MWSGPRVETDHIFLSVCSPRRRDLHGESAQRLLTAASAHSAHLSLSLFKHFGSSLSDSKPETQGNKGDACRLRQRRPPSLVFCVVRGAPLPTALTWPAELSCGTGTGIF